MYIPKDDSLPLIPKQTPSSQTHPILPQPSGVMQNLFSMASQLKQMAVRNCSSLASGTIKLANGTKTCLNEYFDPSNTGVDTSVSILHSCHRLKKHDKDLSHLFEFVSDKAEHYYKSQATNLQKFLIQIIKGSTQSLVFDTVGNFTVWVMNMSEDLIAKTIKANILHIAANLADRAFDPSHPFGDKKMNPIGRLLSVIIKCFTDYQDALNKVLLLPDLERPQAYQKIFQELSAKLLNTCFPLGATDIQLFSDIPCMTLGKEYIWSQIEKMLPPLLEQFYFQTRPLSDLCPDWKNQFNQEAHGVEADQLLNLPGMLFQNCIRGNGASVLNKLSLPLEDFLKQQGCQTDQAEEMTQLIIKSGKELVLSDDPLLQTLGAFFDRYFMERILNNLSNYVPDDIHEPFPTHIVKNWTQGNVFNLILSNLSGKQNFQNKSAAIDELLAPFGLNQQHTFPLPALLIDKKWPEIDKFIKDTLPDLIFTNIPQWYALGSKRAHQRKINIWLDDASATKTILNCSDQAIEGGIKKFVDSKQSIAGLLDQKLFSPVLSQDQQNKLDEQFNALLKDDLFHNNPTLKILKDFGKNCTEALALQLLENMYMHYQESLALDHLKDIQEDVAPLNDTLLDDSSSSPIDLPFEGLPANIIDLGVPVLPAANKIDSNSLYFVPWLTGELNTAFRKLVVDNANGNDLKDLLKIIHLKNTQLREKDPLLAKKAADELDRLWPKVEPKFCELSRDLLEIMGCDGMNSLPFPDVLKPFLWKMLMEKLPRILFDQISDPLLPFLEKQELKVQVKALSNGDLISRGCEGVARDIVKHAPKLLEEKIDALAQKLQTLPGVDLTKKAQTEIVANLRSLLKGEDPAYKDVWVDLQSLLEGILLKISLRARQLNASDLVKIQDLIQSTKDALSKAGNAFPSIPIAPTKNEILKDFTEKFLAILGIETSQDIYAIPKALQEILYSTVKENMADALLKLYDWESKIRNWTIQPNTIENTVPTTLISKAISSLILYDVERGTDKLAERSQGKMVIIPKINDTLNENLSELAKKDYQTAAIFQEVIAKAIPTPYFIGLFDQLNAPTLEPAIGNVADWIAPVLTDKIIGCLNPLLEKEKKGQAEFDQKLLMAALPVLTQHLKHLNQASKTSQGLNLYNFSKAAASHLHPALALGVGQGDISKDFFNEQINLVFQLVFPNGIADLKALLPEFFTDDQLKDIEKLAKKMAVEIIPSSLETLFDREDLVILFNEVFEDAVKALDGPIEIKAAVQTLARSPSEKKRQDEMDKMAGELFMEAAQFLELPFRMPLGMFKKTIAASIGATLREKFNGEFLVKALEKSLPKMANEKYIKRDEAGRIQAQAADVKKLEVLERQLVEKSIGYFFRYLAASINYKTDIFRNPVLKFLRNSIFAVCSFVFFKIMGTLLRILQIKRLTALCLHSLIHHRTAKVLKVLQQGEMHQNAIYYGIDALKGFFTNLPSEINT